MEASSPRGSPRNSPNPTKRMIATTIPSIRLRATKPKSYRPLSQSYSNTSVGGDTDSLESEDDLLRELAASTEGGQSSIALLAENYKKLEKSGKLKSWNLGGKIKTPKTSIFTLGKFSKSYQALNRRFRHDTMKSKVQADRDAHSDNEESDLTANTPLLLSKSASHLGPPPKPPRTFKQRKLDLTGDMDNPQTLFDENDNFSSHLLSVIKEMGVICSNDDKNEDKNDGDSKESSPSSLPNGGLGVLPSRNSASSSSSPDLVSPECSCSPKAKSPLATEPSVRAFPPPPPLSPVKEGQVASRDKESALSSESLVSPVSIVSSQVSVFEEKRDKEAADSTESAGDHESEEALTSKTQQSADDTMNAPSETQRSTDNTQQDTGDTTNVSNEVQSSISGTNKESVPCRIEANAPNNSELSIEHVSSHVEDHMSEQLKLGSVSSPNELTVPGSSSSGEGEIYDDKRMSMISVASTDWYSFEEDEADEDTGSNFSFEIHDPRSVLNLMSPSNTTEEDVPLFSTPPSSPPLQLQVSDQKPPTGRTNSDHPRPKSASPADKGLRGGLDSRKRRDVRSSSPYVKSTSSLGNGQSGSSTTGEERESRGSKSSSLPRPRSASPYRQGEKFGQDKYGTLRASNPPSKTQLSSQEEETDDDRYGTLRPGHSQRRAQHSPQGEREKGVTSPVHQSWQERVKLDGPSLKPEQRAHSTTSLEDSQKTVINGESRDIREMDTSYDSTCTEEASFLSKSMEINTSDQTSDTPKKAFSANTSPSDKRRMTSSSQLTRSATDIALEAISKMDSPKITRKRCSTISGEIDKEPSRELLKRDEYDLLRLIRETKTQKGANLVASFSEQDIADIFKSTLRDKAPAVTVETVGEESEKEDPDTDGGGKGGGGGGREREGSDSHNRLQNLKMLVSRDSSPERIEPVIIPDSIAPDQVR